jgi:hypothetical protein
MNFLASASTKDSKIEYAARASALCNVSVPCIMPAIELLNAWDIGAKALRQVLDE